MQILGNLGYFIVVLGIIIFVHEFGHFIVAREEVGLDLREKCGRETKEGEQDARNSTGG